MTETRALGGAGSAGRGPERADTGERAGAGSGSGRRARITTWKGRVQMRRWTGRAGEPQPGGCGREGVAAASGALRTSRSEPGAGRGRGRALTVRSGAPRWSRCHRPKPRRAQPPQQQVAPPRPPRSILTPTRAPQPRATAPPPKMASPAPRPPHNAARRDVIHPRAAGRGSGETEAEVHDAGLSRILWSACNRLWLGGLIRHTSRDRGGGRMPGGQGTPSAARS